MPGAGASRWWKTYCVASWIVIGLFTFMAGAHVVLTLLFYTGVRDTGVGFVLGWEWPAWLITLIDATVAGLFWFAYRHGAADPRRGLVATTVATIMALARAAWMAPLWILLIIMIAGSIARLARRPDISAGA